LHIISIIFPKFLSYKIILFLIIIGACATIAGAVSGNAATLSVPLFYKNNSDFKEHLFFANLLVWTSILSSVILILLDIKSLSNKYITLLIILILSIGSLVTGKHGHDLVYKYGIGTSIINE
tara:strand:+ start:320 stop:685 length:366 start_codon:yes stop_codon:yes gene_type:complete